MDNTYNGFVGNGTKDSAWATWNICLWVDNEQPIYTAKMRFLREKAYTAADVNAESCRALCDSWFVNGTPDMDTNEYDDVCWDEVAENWQEEFYTCQEEDRSDEENALRKEFGTERTDDLDDQRVLEAAISYIKDMDRDERIEFVLEHVMENNV